jgi:hypothetical protein
MQWLVEEYDDHVKELVAEIRKQGHECDFLNYYKMTKDNNYTGIGLPKGCGVFDPHQPVLFYGSIQLANWIHRSKPEWIPGVWYNYDKYKVSHWSTKLGKYMLNEDFYILPVAEITRRWEWLFNNIGDGHNLFIRPDNGTKAFGGKTFYKENWKIDWENASHLMEPHELCVVSYPCNIDREWRFIVADGQVITGSQYKDHVSAEIQNIIPSDYEANRAWKFAQKIADEKYDPDPMYTIDICICHGNMFYLVEINNFCCSGLYACDLPKIVAKASEIATKEFNELHGVIYLP